jgi:hypothetical protein
MRAQNSQKDLAQIELSFAREPRHDCAWLAVRKPGTAKHKDTRLRHKKNIKFAHNDLTHDVLLDYIQNPTN